MPFKKGQSGNPAGRKPGTANKATLELRQFASKYTKEAIQGLVALARSAESESARVQAWREVLDRAAGRPAQALTDGDGEPLQFPAAITFILRQQAGADNRT